MAYNFKTDTRSRQFIAKYTDPETNETRNVYIIITDSADAADIESIIDLDGLYVMVSSTPFLIGEDPEPDGDGE